MDPRISIIIVSYNTREVLRQCLASVHDELGGGGEAIVVDNASADGSADMVARDFPGLQLVRNEENVGFSPANNTGLARAKGAYVLFLNPDTILPKGTLSTWLTAHEAAQASLSGPTLKGLEGRKQVSAWRIPGIRESVLELFYLHRWLRPGRYPEAWADRDHEAGFVSGAAMLAPRQLIQDLGGFDPNMFWMEDADLCLRVRQAKGRVMFLHEPWITHIGGESAKKNPARAITNQLLSRVKFMRKHRGGFAMAVVYGTVWLHALSRMIVFSGMALFRQEPRGGAYRQAFVKLNRYLFRGDGAI